jgi:inorganic pyrophosphatase
MKNLNSLFLILLLCSCKHSVQVERKADLLYDRPVFAADSSVNVVIEIPAGTCLKTEYDQSKNEFSVERLQDGALRRVQFLPYPGNYGFIPSTEMRLDLGGDGDALDVLVLAEALPKGQILETIPIALLKLKDDEKLDYKIIAVPKDPKLQLINCMSFACLQQNYPAIISILELWFAHYKGSNKTEVIGWDSEELANQEIHKWMR